MSKKYIFKIHTMSGNTHADQACFEMLFLSTLEDIFNVIVNSPPQILSEAEMMRFRSYVRSFLVSNLHKFFYITQDYIKYKIEPLVLRIQAIDRGNMTYEEENLVMRGGLLVTVFG